MKHRKPNLKIAVILAIAAIPTLTRADIVELPLACTGEYSFLQTWSTQFDVGVAFTEISSIYMNWSGEITAKEILPGGTADGLFTASLYESDPHSYFGHAYIQGGSATHPDPEPFDTQSMFSNEGWSPLLDGQARIQIMLSNVSHPLDAGTLSLPSGTLDSATLVIEGQPIPEPGILSMLLLGIGIVRARHRESWTFAESSSGIPTSHPMIERRKP